jgi:hypothetical protein
MRQRWRRGGELLARTLCRALLMCAVACAAADATVASGPMRPSFNLFRPPSPGNVLNAALDTARAGVASRVAGDLASKAEWAGRVKADLDAKAEAAARMQEALDAKAAASAAKVQADAEAVAAATAGAHFADASRKASMGAAKQASNRLALEFGALPLGALGLGVKASLAKPPLLPPLAAKAALGAGAAALASAAASASDGAPAPVSKVTVGSGYPAAADYSPGVCTGYAMCVPGHVPPSYVPAVADCPAGYELDENGL